MTPPHATYASANSFHQLVTEEPLSDSIGLEICHFKMPGPIVAVCLAGMTSIVSKGAQLATVFNIKRDILVKYNTWRCIIIYIECIHATPELAQVSCINPTATCHCYIAEF